MDKYSGGDGFRGIYPVAHHSKVPLQVFSGEATPSLEDKFFEHNGGIASFLHFDLHFLLSALFHRHQQVRKEHGNPRDIGNEHERDQHGDIEGNTPF